LIGIAIFVILSHLPLSAKTLICPITPVSENYECSTTS
jgi:hypothetical protein